MDRAFLDLPNNVYGEISGATEPSSVADAFAALGWSVRRSGAREYEIEHTWASLTIVPTTPLTYSGVVDPAQVQRLRDTFLASGHTATAELELHGLVWSDTLLEDARRIHTEVQAELAAAGVPGDLVLTGASSLPGLLTRGDVDLHLRVPPETFPAVLAALDTRYPRASLHSWAATLAVYAVPGFAHPTGLAVTPVDSEHDHRFTRGWARLDADAGLRTQYNILKQTAPDDQTYEAEKSAFFSRLLL
ncbi:hypothetical protein [Kribbella sancticallisti]|uniref:hypothetical protein n=1 Tax=Kribbella sancticallisti TaxID=460087 RepID=UPI0031E49852